MKINSPSVHPQGILKFELTVELRHVNSCVVIFLCNSCVAFRHFSAKVFQAVMMIYFGKKRKVLCVPLYFTDHFKMTEYDATVKTTVKLGTKRNKNADNNQNSIGVKIQYNVIFVQKLLLHWKDWCLFYEILYRLEEQFQRFLTSSIVWTSRKMTLYKTCDILREIFRVKMSFFEQICHYNGFSHRLSFD